MKSTFFLSIVCIGSGFPLLAQHPTLFEVAKGQVTTQVIPLQQQYRWEQFRDGNVSYYNGQSLPARLNYNLLYGEMQFIDRRGDTLSLVNEPPLKQITIEGAVFYPLGKRGYLEVLGDYVRVKLARKQHFQLTKSEVDLQGRGASQAPAVGLAGISGQFSAGSVGGKAGISYRELYTHKAPGALAVTKRDTYYLVDRNNRSYAVNKASLSKLFPRHRKAVDKYLREQQPNFSQESDLQKLLAYCNKLDEQ